MPASARDRSPRSAPVPQLRARLWIETDTGQQALTEAGADLLEQIEASGSLSEAARKLRFSYRRAWMLLDAMNNHWASPLVTTQVGGRRGGGAALTELGLRVLRAYRDLQIQMEHLLDAQRDAFRRSTRD